MIKKGIKIQFFVYNLLECYNALFKIINIKQRSLFTELSNILTEQLSPESQIKYFITKLFLVDIFNFLITSAISCCVFFVLQDILIYLPDAVT